MDTEKYVKKLKYNISSSIEDAIDEVLTTNADQIINNNIEIEIRRAICGAVAESRAEEANKHLPFKPADYKAIVNHVNDLCADRRAHVFLLDDNGENDIAVNLNGNLLDIIRLMNKCIECIASNSSISKDQIYHAIRILDIDNK